MVRYRNGKKRRHEDQKDEKWKFGSRLQVAEAQLRYLERTRREQVECQNIHRCTYEASGQHNECDIKHRQCLEQQAKRGQ